MYATARKYLGISLISLAAVLPINAQSHPQISPQVLAYRALKRIATHKINPTTATGLEKAIVREEARRQIYGLADFLRNKNGVAEESEVSYALEMLKRAYPDVRAEIIATSPYKDREPIRRRFLEFYPGFQELFQHKQEFARK